MLVSCKSAVRLKEEPHSKKNGDEEPIPEDEENLMLTMA